MKMNNIRRDLNLTVFLFVFMLFCGSMVAIAGSLRAQNDSGVQLQGKYLTEDYNTESADGMIKVTYTFTGDSLYIDAYPSGCGIAYMKLEYEGNDTYRATEALYDQNTGKVIHERVYHLLFLPCKWSKHSYAVYRDGEVVDIIRKIP